MYDKMVSSRSQKIERTAHVQWYEHGCKTILQETAHPYGLFALPECADVPVGTILGRCIVRHMKPGDEEPYDYHCRLLLPRLIPT
jgi:DNA (cytosine-5)-methyltransferase 1